MNTLFDSLLKVGLGLFLGVLLAWFWWPDEPQQPGTRRFRARA